MSSSNPGNFQPVPQDPPARCGLDDTAVAADTSAASVGAQVHPFPALTPEDDRQIKQVPRAISAAIGNQVAAQAAKLSARQAGYDLGGLAALASETASIGPMRAVDDTSCDPCRSALGPGAYLLDLIAFVSQVFGQSLPALDYRFLQQLARLPLDRAAVNDTVRQGRLAVEVLERFVLGNPPAPPGWPGKQPGWTRDWLYAQMAGLPVTGTPPAQPRVLVDELEGFLTELGTSRAEIAQAISGGTLPALAARIHLAPSEIESLNLQDSQITITQVERLPGLIREAFTAGIDAQTQPDAYQAALDRVTAVLARVETRCLPGLRSNLVRIALREAPEYGSVQALEDYLAIDLTSDPSQVTTRVGQAIGTIQSVVQASRLGTPAGWPLGPDWDDQRWSWTQSYSTWHAAQTVFFYPENYLLPGLRRDQTPAFRAFLEVVETSSITPASVHAAVMSYAEQILHECVGRTLWFSVTVDNRVLLISGGAADGVFISEQTADGEWRGWRKLDGLPGDTLVGAGGFLGRLYLFFVLPSGTTTNLAVSSILPDGLTPSPLKDTKIPWLGASFDDCAVVAGADGLVVYQRVRGAGVVTFNRAVMDRFEQWTAGSFSDPSVVASDAPLRAVGNVDGSDYLLVARQLTIQNYALTLVRVDDPYGAAPTASTVATLRTVDPSQPLTYAGIVRGDGTHHAVVVYRTTLSPTDPRWVEQVAEFAPNTSPSWHNVPDLTSELIGLVWLRDERVLLVHGSQDYSGLGLVDGTPTRLVRGRTTVDLTNRFIIHPVPASEAALNDYQDRQLGVYAATAPGDFARLILDEWYLFVPLAAARALSGAGHYSEAADWLNVLYYPYRPEIAQATSSTAPAMTVPTAAVEQPTILASPSAEAPTAPPEELASEPTLGTTALTKPVVINAPTSTTPVTSLQQILRVTITPKEGATDQRWCARVQGTADMFEPPVSEFTFPLRTGELDELIGELPLAQVPNPQGHLPAIQPGANTIKVWAQDSRGPYGNPAAIVSFTFHDIDPPQVSVSAPPVVRGTGGRLVATIEEPFGIAGWIARVQLAPDPAPDPGDPAWTASGLQPGSSPTSYRVELALTSATIPGFHLGANTIYFWAKDASNNIGSASAQVFVPSARRIYAGFNETGAAATDIRTTLAWLRDPLNPYAIARTRPGIFLRHTVLAQIENLLDWADGQFGRDTSESVNQARTLYELALALLGYDELAARPDTSLLRQLDQQVTQAFAYPQATRLRAAVRQLAGNDGRVAIPETISAAQAVLSADLPPAERARQIEALVQDALSTSRRSTEASTVDQALGALQLAATSSVNLSALGPAGSDDVGALASGLATIEPEVGWAPSGLVPSGFCLPPNPRLGTDRTRAQANLAKIREGLNYAGMRRTLDIYALATDPRITGDGLGQPDDEPNEPPPLYRYSYLLERARYFISIAQQVEAAMLVADEKEAAESYTLMKARQDQKLAADNVRLRDLQAQEARDSTTAAMLQRDKVDFERQHYHDLLATPLGGVDGFEALALGLQIGAAILPFIPGAGAAAQAAVTGIDAGASAIVAAIQGLQPNRLQGLLSGAGQIVSTGASYERREQEWRYQLDLATKDYAIADQQVTLAGDREEIVGQEGQIARDTSQFASDMVSFLLNKFTSAALYRWMSQLLRGIYRDQLNIAVSVARMAQQAVSFERQEPVNFIGTGYWDAERQGLLAAERLLNDLNRLDQARFSTTQRKRELTKVISLATAAPVEFEQLRASGVMYFTTPMDWFDRDFPGHYLRMIKQVSLTFVALIPPTEGVHVTLSNPGTSRIMVGPPFSTLGTILRQPEAISVTAPNVGTGLFEINLNDPLLLPFEESGVETSWSLELPPGANRWDLTSLVDVLLTIRYTALDSWDYRQKILDAWQADADGWVVVEERALFSTRYRFPDQWYQFQNPTFLAGSEGDADPRGARPYAMRLDLAPSDFPPNSRALTRSELPPGTQSSALTWRLSLLAGGTVPGRVPLEVSFAPASGGLSYTTTVDLVDGQAIVGPSQALPLDTLHPDGTWALRVRNEADPSTYPEVIGSGVGGGRVTWDRAGTAARENSALAANGATATASSTLIDETNPSIAINGDPIGGDPSQAQWHWLKCWTDNTDGDFHDDWIQVTFDDMKTITEIDVYTIQDAALDGSAPPVQPTEALTFQHFGLTEFDVQYWTDAAWATIPGGNVTGNDRVWRRFTFSPITTDRIRIVGHDAADHRYCRIVEIEAYEGVDATRRDVARDTNGGRATASSSLWHFPPRLAIDGGRFGSGWAAAGSITDSPTDPTWLQVIFASARPVSEVHVFSHQDLTGPILEPTEAMTFSQFGLIDFDVQYWDGSGWVTVPGGSIRDNWRVWRKVTFPAVTTDRIRVLIQRTPDGHARVVEVEAYGPGWVDTVWVDDALPAGVSPGGDEPWEWVGADPAPFSGGRAHRSSLATGTRQHFFTGAGPLPVRSGDVLFAYAYLDPNNVPSEIMLQWNDGTTWEHRAYWGLNVIDRGAADTDGRRWMGPLPPAGQWVRLEVPARLVGLEGRQVAGIAFTVYGERKIDLAWMSDLMLSIQYPARTRYVR